MRHPRLFTLFLLLLGEFAYNGGGIHAVHAQNTLDSVATAALLVQIRQAAQSVKNLTCNFEQIRTSSLLQDSILSRGKMLFRAPNELLWSYDEPKKIRFVVTNSGEVNIHVDGKEKNLGSTQKKYLKQMSRFLLNLISGNYLNALNDFRTEIAPQNGGGYILHLYPKKKELRRLFKQFILQLRPDLQSATSVTLVEKRGDRTHILFRQLVLNAPVDSTLFR